MRVYANSASIHGACASARGSELGDLIGRRIEELASYDVPDLSALIKVLVVAPDDALAVVDAGLGFSLVGRRCDAAESHRDWFELTLVLSDDGFGAVVYVPKHSNPQLLAYCQNQVRALLP